MASSILGAKESKKKLKANSGDPGNSGNEKFVNDVIARLIQERGAMVQRGQYEPLGKIMKISTAAGWIEFRKGGPALGRLSDGYIDLLEPWPSSLPDLIAVVQGELCPDCKATCDECDGGLRICSYGDHLKVCGGTGKIRQPAGVNFWPSPLAWLIDKLRRKDPAKQCEQCNGTGKVACLNCKGTGKMSTGFKDGARASRSGEYCPSCEGYGLKVTRTPQLIEPHLEKIKDTRYIYIGPVLGIMVRPVGEGQREPQWWKATADVSGNGMYITLPDVAAPANPVFTFAATLLGGSLIPPVQSAAAPRESNQNR